MRKYLLQAGAGCTVALLFALTVGDAVALDCGTFNFPYCSNSKIKPAQYAGDFDPGVGFGGFGGGDCKDKITRTPVVMIHGNGDSAIGWDSPPGARPGRAERQSVYEELKARGYNDCELFGVTYLDAKEQAHAQGNFHQPRKYEIVWKFIQSVKAYTQSPQVDVIGHSLGVSMSLAALDYYTFDKPENAWGSVRRLINIAGGIRGLGSCAAGIYIAATCKAEEIGDNDAYYEFGFYPDIPAPWFPRNRWTAVQSERTLRLAPQRQPAVSFYTIGAGRQDDIHCPLMIPNVLFECSSGPLFEPAKNVRAQVNIGADPKPTSAGVPAIDPGIARVFPRDIGGIGHFGARNSAGPIIAQMLTTDCTRAACKGAYSGRYKLSKP